jgi:hypothetical protein
MSLKPTPTPFLPPVTDVVRPHDLEMPSSVRQTTMVQVQLVINPYLPRDCVQVDAESIKGMWFCKRRPTARPSEVSPTAVLVNVFMLTDEGYLQFKGWMWFEPEVVNQAHDVPKIDKL